MIFFYNISISLYYFSAKVATLFNTKAKQFVEGRRTIFDELKSIDFSENIYWFHCASLGELEQGKPIISSIKENDTNVKILITFFSPSGYE